MHIELSPKALTGLARRTVTIKDEAGVSATYSGVDLGALLAAKGAPADAALRGRAVSNYVLVSAADGYRAVFAPVELDASFVEKIVLLADQRDGAPLLAGDGPFQLVVPDEKHHARWVRSVTEIDLIAAP